MTAVEWLIDEIEKHYIINNGSLNPTVVMELKRQALEMEKEQIKDAFNFGVYDGGGIIKKYKMSGEQYYNETFKLK